MGEPRNEVKRFAENMEHKLSCHDDRPGWKDCDPEWLLSRLKEEIAEVERVLREKGNGWLTDLAFECADVGNFAMIIHDASVHQWAEKVAKDWEGPLPGDEFRR